MPLLRSSVRTFSALEHHLAEGLAEHMSIQSGHSPSLRRTPLLGAEVWVRVLPDAQLKPVMQAGEVNCFAGAAGDALPQGPVSLNRDYEVNFSKSKNCTISGLNLKCTQLTPGNFVRIRVSYVHFSHCLRARESIRLRHGAQHAGLDWCPTSAPCSSAQRRRLRTFPRGPLPSTHARRCRG